MKFFFSIIIPVYNSEDYLRRCLDSVVKQTFDKDKVQVIVVNDGSPRTKECNEIVSSYNGKLKLNYIILKENKGLFLARKTGVEKVQGEYFLHLDSDDYLEKKALQALYEDIQKNSDVDYIEFNAMQLRRGCFKLKYTFLLPRDAQTNAIDIVYNDGGHQTRIFNKCFKTAFAKPIYHSMTEDYIFFTEDYYQTCILDHFAKKRRILPKYLYVYAIGTGITASQIYTKEKIKKIILSCVNIEKNLLDFYKKQGVEQYSERLRQHTIELYLWLIEHSKMEEFIECCKEMLDEQTLENILLRYLGRTSSAVKASQKSKKISLLLEKLKRYLKRRFRK